MTRMFLLALIACAFCAGSAWAETGGWFGGDVVVPDRHGGVAVAAGSVTVAGRVDGDAAIAAGQVRINGDVDGDARVLSGEYHQSGNVSGELALASAKADIDGSVGDDLYAASEEVHLGADTRIGRNARITGHDLLIKGRVDGDLDLRGETVALDAQVGGSVTVRAKHIIVGPDTTIEGALDWKGAEAPDISSDAIISHGVKGKIVKRWDKDGWGAWDRPWSAAPREAIFAGEAALRLMVGLSALLIGLVFTLGAPDAADKARARLRAHWPLSIALGAGAALLTPAVALTLALTIVAIPIGVLALLAYPFVLLTGYAVGAATVGGLLLIRAPPGPTMRALGAGLGVAALTAIGFLPWLGLAAGLVTTLVGLGLLLMMFRTPPRQAASASTDSAMRETAA